MLLEFIIMLVDERKNGEDMNLWFFCYEVMSFCMIFYFYGFDNVKFHPQF